MKPRRIAIFGGTFNPIHNGHLHLLDAYRRELSPDLTLLIPTRVPPHKITDLAPEADRLAMCEIAVRGISDVRVSDLEFRREGPSYTADTLDELAGIYGEEADFYLIVGSDMFLSLETWYDYERIFHRATLCTAAREYGDYERLKAYADHLARRYHARSVVYPLDVMVVSSTELRKRLERGADVSAWVPAGVAAYIRERGLYRGRAHAEGETTPPAGC